jgi:hypothetical protein
MAYSPVYNHCVLVQDFSLRSPTMPNGRSGGFVVERADLKQLIKALPDATVVGKIRAYSSALRPADALEIARLVDECPNDRIPVEEQDHKFYIIHLSDKGERIWVMVGPETPLFLELRQRHARWATEHPEWKGWIAF